MTRRTPGEGTGGTGNAGMGVKLQGTSLAAIVSLTGDPEADAAEILEHLDPHAARHLALELERAADRIDRPTRRSPYIGPSCDHPAGIGWVWDETYAEKERMGARR